MTSDNSVKSERKEEQSPITRGYEKLIFGEEVDWSEVYTARFSMSEKTLGDPIGFFLLKDLEYAGEINQIDRKNGSPTVGDFISFGELVYENHPGIAFGYTGYVDNPKKSGPNVVVDGIVARGDISEEFIEEVRDLAGVSELSPREIDGEVTVEGDYLRAWWD